MKELKTIKKYKSVADHFRDMLINFDYVEKNTCSEAVTRGVL